MTWAEKWTELLEIFSATGAALAVIVILGIVIKLSYRTHHADVDATPTAGPEPVTIQTPTAALRGFPAVDKIFVALEAGMPMRRKERIEAVAGFGLAGDRYSTLRGHWSHTDGCQVTMIAQEDLDEITRTTNVKVQNGEHRRNLVTRDIDMDDLIGKRFRIGTAFFGYDCPRPPCAYIQLISEAGMPRALGRRAGICIRCIKSGTIREGDRIEIFETTPWQALSQAIRTQLRRWRSRNHG